MDATVINMLLHKACVFLYIFMFIFKCCAPLCMWRKLYCDKTELFQRLRAIHNENRLTLFLQPNGTSNPTCPEIPSQTLFTSQMCPVHSSQKTQVSPDRICGNSSLQDSSWRHVTSPEGSWRFSLRLVRHRSWTGSQSISPDGSKYVCFSVLQ